MDTVLMWMAEQANPMPFFSGKRAKPDPKCGIGKISTRDLARYLRTTTLFFYTEHGQSPLGCGLHHEPLLNGNDICLMIIINCAADR